MQKVVARKSASADVQIGSRKPKTESCCIGSSQSEVDGSLITVECCHRQYQVGMAAAHMLQFLFFMGGDSL